MADRKEVKEIIRPATRLEALKGRIPQKVLDTAGGLAKIAALAPIPAAKLPLAALAANPKVNIPAFKLIQRVRDLLSFSKRSAFTAGQKGKARQALKEANQALAEVKKLGPSEFIKFRGATTGQLVQQKKGQIGKLKKAIEIRLRKKSAPAPKIPRRE